MSETRKREKWFNLLDVELTKYFDEHEKKEIMSYYEEMIDDRLENNEYIDDVLNDYDPKVIARTMVPKVMTKRMTTHDKASRNAWLIVLILFSTPILIPLGVVYLSLMISALSVMISGVAVVAAGVFAIIAQIGRGFIYGFATPEFMVTVGTGLLAFVICSLIGYAIIKVSWWVLQHLAIWFSRLVAGKKA